MARQGIVKWFDEKKGFGFICDDTEGKDYFVHFSAINGQGFRSLTEGDRVSFDLGRNEKGTVAVSVKKN